MLSSLYGDLAAFLSVLFLLIWLKNLLVQLVIFFAWSNLICSFFLTFFLFLEYLSLLALLFDFFFIPCTFSDYF